MGMDLGAFDRVLSARRDVNDDALVQSGDRHDDPRLSVRPSLAKLSQMRIPCGAGLT